jgi:hypothetical protein
MFSAMKKFHTLSLVLGLATLAGFTAPSSAQAQSISCPLEKIRLEVTTRLPSGWWNTPQVNVLQNTRVITLGGKKTLQCDYGSAGRIMHLAPAGRTCAAVSGGFNCLAPAVARPRTFNSQAVTLRQTYLADFDRNSSSNSAADIWFQAETRDLLYLVPRNGAQIGVGNRRNRGFDGCSTARFTSSRVSLSDVPVGSYICMKTNEGRISQFRMNNISGGSPKVLQLGYTTWE